MIKKGHLHKVSKGLLKLLLILAAMSAAGCGRQAEAGEDASDGRLKIVCTIFPSYDWTKQILGEQEKETELILLMKNGADLHSYQPTVWDMVNISEADLFCYVGGESDFWVEDALKNAKNPDIKVLNLMEILEGSVKEEEYTEGMQRTRGHMNYESEAHDHEKKDRINSVHSHHGEEEPEYDEHIWLSLRNAEAVCRAVKDALCELDAGHSDIYERNCADYVQKLCSLDMEYMQAAEQSSGPTLLFGDRFPFRYLVEDYGISYYAAFSGCSAETEAGFETITFLAGKADELKLPAVLAIDGSDERIARTIAGNTKTRDQQVLVLDSMQSVSEQDIREGESYLSIMEKNLEVLRTALSETGRQS
ncbi:MAG: metal ABC transporter substrate-binding protein [Lachnospiraceae bacterium]